MSPLPSPFKSAETIEVYMVNGVSKLATPPQPMHAYANRRVMKGNLRSKLLDPNGSLLPTDLKSFVPLKGFNSRQTLPYPPFPPKHSGCLRGVWCPCGLR